MRVFSKKQLQKIYGGAIMFQVLLGLGLMVMMSPMIFSQIKKYNEEIQREDVVHDLETWQKAATSFVMFEKDKPGIIPDGRNEWSGNSLKTLLSDYLGSNAVNVKNNFGQTYSLITLRDGEQVEAVVIASGGGVDRLVINGIGQFLFDKGFVIDADGTILSDFKLSNDLTDYIKSKVSPSEGGALVMFVSDSFFASDFLHISKMQGNSDRSSLVNTMIVNLDMGNNDMDYVANLYGTKLSVIDADIDNVSVSDLVVSSVSDISKNFEYQGIDGINSQGRLPVDLVADSVDSDLGKEVDIKENMTIAGDARFNRVYIENADLETDVLNPDGGLNQIVVDGDVDVDEPSDLKEMNIESISAKTLASENGTTFDKIDEIVLSKSDIVNNTNSLVYIGPSTVDSSGNRSYDMDKTLVLDLSGTSDIRDVCYGSPEVCLSDEILNYYLSLQSLLQEFFENRCNDYEGQDRTDCLNGKEINKD